jgi:GST-like protein
MLIYMAEKTGRFMPAEPRARYDVLQWLMFQMGGIGPMFGQANHFRSYAPERIPYAIERYTNEAGRLYGVMERRLAEVDYLAGEYSIADMATWPWMRNPDRRGQNIDDFPNVKRWFEAIGARPAVQRGIKVLEDAGRSGDITPEEREILFGAKQYERR